MLYRAFRIKHLISVCFVRHKNTVIIIYYYYYYYINIHKVCKLTGCLHEKIFIKTKN